MTETRTTDRRIRLGASGSTIEILATSEETGGALSLYRWRMAPTSSGPAPHFHTTFAETFVVEEGEVDHFDGLAWRTLRPGQSAHSPMGGVHAIRKQSNEGATLLIVLSPGVPRERYFAALATADEHDIAALHEAHDNHFVEERR